jgi:hypothetical protein
MSLFEILFERRNLYHTDAREIYSDNIYSGD